MKTYGRRRTAGTCGGAVAVVLAVALVVAPAEIDQVEERVGQERNPAPNHHLVAKNGFHLFHFLYRLHRHSKKPSFNFQWNTSQIFKKWHSCLWEKVGCFPNPGFCCTVASRLNMKHCIEPSRTQQKNVLKSVTERKWIFFQTASGQSLNSFNPSLYFNVIQRSEELSGRAFICYW